MEWKDTYNIGVKEIDDQHRQLADMITRLEKALSTELVNKEIGNTLKFLVDYTKKHFAAEEEVMVGSGFPGLSQHKELHKNLINDVMGVLLGLKKGRAIEPEKLITFLTNWLINHILEEDKQIGEHIAKKEQVPGVSESQVPSQGPMDLPELMKKFKKLKALFTQKLIAEADYLEKKSHFLNDLCASGKDDEQDDLLKRFEFLSELMLKKFITKDEAKASKAMILEHHALDDLISGITAIEDRFQFLKNLLDEGTIASDQYDELKTKLLMDI